ncbi:NAD+ diphosphatase [Thermosporothrix hazakensis]|jgi:NAD+ diphosphatase|uniref:NAD(+) diphosphatase n=2 Tax=Thermosporothrix TaxID=768650 RepID=A0A326UBF7_THEHA|nr:NAD(+) diphosphatase [Thermosporothrix hazakensis]PZW34420.1 NAD+ diphosphatase [Thermosporothrix hazakensis]BBH85543.1 NADH pyrophosphatase [Thermosporothrix sp. COM3]GCE46030.1 NADH pyrophosphatase [Thermosporothrix hazakensis]
MTFQRAYPPAVPASGPAYWLPFRQGKLLTQHGLIQASSDLPEGIHPLYIGTLDGIPCLAWELDDNATIPESWQPTAVRALFGTIDEAAYSAVGYAMHLLYWVRTHRYCPTCAQPLGPLSEQWSRQCPACGYIGYPPVSPAILVLIHDGDRVLLTHKPGWNARYSVIAGFVEPGESLEECVRREVMEEVGVEITDIVYKSSQPWPYPQQLMVAYTARYVSGDIRLDEAELDDARWFRYDNLPEIPAPLSLSYHLIADWARERSEQQQH